jgi:hypothetical protein
LPPDPSHRSPNYNEYQPIVVRALPPHNAAMLGAPYNGLHGSSSTKRQNGREAVTQSQGSAALPADRPVAERVIDFDRRLSRSG